MPRRKPILALLYAAALGATSAAVASIAVGGWMGEVLANLRLYLVLLAAMLAVCAWALPVQPVMRAGLCLAVLGLGASQALALLPYMVEAPPAALQPSGSLPGLRLLQANLHSWAVGNEALRRLLREGGADIAVLTEITSVQQPVYKELTDLYPQQFETPVGRDNTFIVRVLSRRPMSVTLFHPVPEDYPVLQARFCTLAVRCLTLLASHAPRPGPDGRGVRNAVLGEIAGLARQAWAAGDLVVAAGDFNVTAFSPDFAILTQAGLLDSALGRGYPASWPVFLGPLGIGIDQVLVSPGIAVSGRWLGPDIGSDHYPLFLELELADRR